MTLRDVASKKYSFLLLSIDLRRHPPTSKKSSRESALISDYFVRHWRRCVGKLLVDLLGSGKILRPIIFPSQTTCPKLLPSLQRIFIFVNRKSRLSSPAIFANTSMLLQPTFQSDNQIPSNLSRSYSLRIRRDELTQNCRPLTR